MVCSILLCLALALLCGTALADDLTVEAHPLDASAVQVEKTDRDGDAVFTVTKSSGVEDGQLYLVLIMSGSDPAAKPVPTKDNVYYLDVDAASGSSISFEAYPRDLAEGDYVVYLSDWSSGSDGAAKSVATITVGGGETYECGDVNHSGGKPDNRDVRDLARYVGEWPDYLPDGSKAIDESLGDVNGSGGKPDNRDVRDLARYVGEWTDYPTLPHTK